MKLSIKSTMRLEEKVVLVTKKVKVTSIEKDINIEENQKMRLTTICI
jgi:hypothetical protein